MNRHDLSTIVELEPLSEDENAKLHRLWQLSLAANQERTRIARMLRDAETKEIRALNEFRAYLNTVSISLTEPAH